MKIPGTGWEIQAAVRGRPSTKDPYRSTAEYTQIATSYSTGSGKTRALPKPTPTNLRRLMETPAGRRALNSIKNPVLAKPWVIRPRRGIELDDQLRREIEIANNVFDEPNPDDSFYSLMGKWLEDELTGGWGPIEAKTNGNQDHPLWLWNIDGPTIHVVAGWNGKPNGVRYAQQFPGLAQPIPLTDDECFYIKPNPRTHTPFGLGPGEVAFNMINYLLGAIKTSHRTAANEKPPYLIHLGMQLKPEEVLKFRAYWEDEIEGTGRAPIIGGSENPSVLKMFDGNDMSGRIKWQEFLMLLIAISFDTSPGKLGLNRDINRSTKEGQMQEDQETGEDPWAKLLAVEFTRHVLWRRLGFRRLELSYDEVDVKEELTKAQTREIYVRSGVLLVNEVREDIGRRPLPEDRGNLETQQPVP